MIVACLDLEGVLVPEIWINVAERTGIAELRRTTRDEPDYDKLMRGRLAILDRHKLGIREISAVIATLESVKSDIAYGKQLAVRSTPTFFINGVKVEGAWAPQFFDQAIAYELQHTATK